MPVVNTKDGKTMAYLELVSKSHRTYGLHAGENGLDFPCSEADLPPMGEDQGRYLETPGRGLSFDIQEFAGEWLNAAKYHRLQMRIENY